MKMKENIEQLLKDFMEVSDLFYKQKNSEAHNKLLLLLNDIENAMNDLVNLKQEDKNILFDEAKINEILLQAMNALENSDYILLADLINYELKEQFEKVMDNL